MQLPADTTIEEVMQRMLRDPRLTTVAEAIAPLLGTTVGYDAFHRAAVLTIQETLDVDHQEACLWVALSRHLLFPSMTTSNKVN